MEGPRIAFDEAQCPLLEPGDPPICKSRKFQHRRSRKADHGNFSSRPRPALPGARGGDHARPMAAPLHRSRGRRSGDAGKTRLETRRVSNVPAPAHSGSRRNSVPLAHRGPGLPLRNSISCHRPWLVVSDAIRSIEAARVHHAARQRGGRLAVLGASAAACDTGDWFPQEHIDRTLGAHGGGRVMTTKQYLAALKRLGVVPVNSIHAVLAS
jgi:hypothetical protein